MIIQNNRCLEVEPVYKLANIKNNNRSNNRQNQNNKKENKSKSFSEIFEEELNKYKK